MTDLTWPLQQALITALKAELTGIPVYDRVPDQPEYPHVHVGEISSEPFGGKNSAGLHHEIMVHTWSSYRGAKEALGILGQIAGLLHHKQLFVDGAVRPVTGDIIWTNCILDADGLKHHGMQRMRYFTDS